MSVNWAKATMEFIGCVDGYDGVRVGDCRAAGTLDLPSQRHPHSPSCHSFVSGHASIVRGTGLA